MWITSPPHRSVSYSPRCLFFLFSFWWGGGSLSHVALPPTWSSSSSSQKLNPQSWLLLLLMLLKKEVAKTKTQKQEKTQPVLAHTLLKPSMLQLVKSLLHAPSIGRRENFASYVCIFFVFVEDDIQNQRSSCKTVHRKMVKKPTVSVPNWGRLCFFHKKKKALKKEKQTQIILAFTIPLQTLLCQALKYVSTINQKPKSIKWKAWNCCQKLESCLYNKPETKTSIKSKLEIVAKSLTFVSTTTKNKSIQSKLEILYHLARIEFRSLSGLYGNEQRIYGERSASRGCKSWQSMWIRSSISFAWHFFCRAIRGSDRNIWHHGDFFCSKFLLLIRSSIWQKYCLAPNEISFPRNFLCGWVRGSNAGIAVIESISPDMK